MRIDRHSTSLSNHFHFPLAAVAALLAVVSLSAAEGNRSGEGNATGKSNKPPRDPGAVEVRFIDNSSLKLTLRDERIEVATKYGKLYVPIADIQKIDFGVRIPDDMSKRIDSLVASLGSPHFRVREAASADLLALKERAYPALVQASKNMDMEIAHRAEELVKKLREIVPEDRLAVREHDVVHTEDSKIAGRIVAPTLQVQTFQFGELQLKLADVVSLRAVGIDEPEGEAKNVLPDPGNMKALEGQIGKTFMIRVTGAINGSLWGTDFYTTDSSLAMAAVHTGLVPPGQSGVVKVTIVGPQPAFQGSTRHGVTSSAYGAYPSSYRVHK
jgi:hypothetical protein